MQLSDEEIIHINQVAYSICSDKNIPFICGHPFTSTKDTLLRYCEKLNLAGKASISVLYPERYFGIKKALIDYHTAPISLGYDVLIHQMKLVSGFNGSLIDWEQIVLENLLNNKQVIGMKEDSKNDLIAIPFIKKFADIKNIIVAGGGKERAMSLRKHGLKSWLNGSFMMFPEMCPYYMKALENNDQEFLNNYIEKVERVLFREVVGKYGWHVAHKAVLSIRGFCKYVERPPMPVLDFNEMDNVKLIVNKIENNLEKIVR